MRNTEKFHNGETIGLNRNIVRLADHDPAWAELAEMACSQLREACGGLILDVQHVGSTAVPGLPAKPIIDLAASIALEKTIPQLIRSLTGLGYVYRGDGADQGGHLFVWEPQPEFRSIHLHVVTSDDIQWRNYILFRDLLRTDGNLRQRYGDLKRVLSNRFPEDRKSYTESKHHFIRRVLDGELQRDDLHKGVLLPETNESEKYPR